MKQHIGICGVTGIVLVVFLTIMLLPAYGASKPETGYYILVGSFKNFTNAKQEVNRLKKYKASLSEDSVSGTTWYRVSIGPYKNKDKARSVARQLKQKKVIASYHVRIMAKASPGLEIVSVKKSEPQMEQTISEATPEKAAPISATPSVPETAPAPPLKSTGVVIPPPVTDTTMSMPPQIPEAPAKTDSMVETKPEKTAVDPLPEPVKKAKDWSLTAGYNLWQMDMSKHYVNGNFKSKNFMHGPTIGYAKKKFDISFTYLTTISNKGFNADVHETFDSGEVYHRKEEFKRNDYDATLRYSLLNVSQISASVLAGLKYTRLYDMSSAYTRSAGSYTITGSMDIWGPVLGLELIAPFGNPSQTPFFMSLSGSGMFLRATGNHPQFMPASGGSYGTTFEGADFSANGWGAYADAHFIWKVTNAFQIQLGERYQSASLKDTSPQGYTMRTSNGFFAFYTRMSYDW